MKNFLKENWFKLIIIIAIFAFLLLQWGMFNLERKNYIWQCTSKVESGLLSDVGYRICGNTYSLIRIFFK